MGTPEKTARVVGAIKRRGIALLGLAMIVAGGIWAAVALAATDVSFFGPEGNKTVDFPEDFPQKDVSDTYEVNGEFQKIDGYSLQSALSKIGVSQDGWERIFFDGRVIRNGEEFSGEKVPVFYLSEDDEDVIFLLPKKPDEPAKQFREPDFNYRAAIDIEPDLDEIEPEEGDTQTFEATVLDVPSQNDYSFSWNSSTGQTGAERSFEVTFNSSGRIEIGVEATRNGNVVAEQAVGTAVKAAPEDNSGTFGSGSFGSGGFDSGYTPPTDFGGDFGGDFGDSGSTSPTPNFPEAPDDTPKETTIPEETSGVSVSGELLSQIEALEPSNGEESPAGGEDPAAPEPKPDEVTFEKNEKVTAPGALIAAGVVVGLIGLGAGREIEDVRPRRFLRRPDLSSLRRLLPPWK